VPTSGGTNERVDAARRIKNPSKKPDTPINKQAGSVHADVGLRKSWTPAASLHLRRV
jgi:hypothetical protein